MAVRAAERDRLAGMHRRGVARRMAGQAAAALGGGLFGRLALRRGRRHDVMPLDGLLALARDAGIADHEETQRRDQREQQRAETVEDGGAHQKAKTMLASTE